MSASTLAVLVTGGRHYGEFHRNDSAEMRQIKLAQQQRLFGTLHDLHPDLVLHGGAPGADFLAHRWARDHDVRTEVFPADWVTHGRRAGPMRNRAMCNRLLALKYDDWRTLVLAFPGGRGTASCVREATMRHLRVVQIADVEGAFG